MAAFLSALEITLLISLVLCQPCAGEGEGEGGGGCPAWRAQTCPG